MVIIGEKKTRKAKKEKRDSAFTQILPAGINKISLYKGVGGKKTVYQAPLWLRTFGGLGRGKHSNSGYSERGYW